MARNVSACIRRECIHRECVEIPRVRRVIVDSLPPILRRTAEILGREGRLILIEE